MKRAVYISMGSERRLGGVETYRIDTPMKNINQFSDSWQVDWLAIGEIDLTGHDLVKWLMQYDIVIFPRFFFPTERMRLEMAKLIHLMRQLNIRVLYETDDDYSNEDRQVSNGDAIELMRWSDSLIVTQQYLGDKLRKRSGRSYSICPNSLPALWQDSSLPVHPKPENKIVILLSGGNSHFHDWKVLADPMRRILDTYGDRILFRLSGYYPSYLEDLPHTEYLPGRSYVEYAQLVRSADIVLAPVVPNDKFNLGKSPIKAIEGMGAGAAVVATDNPIYRLAIRQNKSGLLVKHDENSWYEAIESLILDNDLRKRLQVGAYSRAWNKFDARKNWTMWVRAFDTVLRKSVNPISLPIPAGGV